MRIGQVTMYGDNYGACLQAYALQKICRERGHEIELINYHQGVRKNVGSVSKLQKIRLLGIKATLKYIKEHKYIELRKNAYKKFREKYLVFGSGEYYRDDNLKKLNEEYDYFICGSDMIWSEEFANDWKFFFLDFADKEKSFSYAPSFGQNKLNDVNKEIVKQYLRKFNKISCRENGGVDLIESLGISESMQVVDPTMLLSKEEWVQCIPEKKRIIQEPYVFSYLFGEETDGRKKLFKIIETSIGKMYSLPRFNKKAQDAFPINGIGPMDYLRLFRDAEFIVTDTFHGLMFSIIFRKPFVVLNRHDGSNWSKYSDRMTSTLEMFNLSKRYIDEDFEDLEEMRNLDYSEYEDLIIKAREKSINYINSILGSVKHG